MTQLDPRAVGGDEAARPAEGQMSLVEHLRELRGRLVKAILGIVLGMIAAFILYSPLFNVLAAPLEDIRAWALARGLNVQLSMTGLTGPFFLQLKISLVAGLILASPVWLYQIWAFILPGLHRTERRWTVAFFASAVPLFLAGVSLAYWILPKALQLLLSFTPTDTEVLNLITLDGYLNFVVRMVLVFGLGFELPVFVVLLNLAGVFSSVAIRAARRWAYFGILVFAAVATPTGDPVTMLILGVPIMILWEVAGFIAFLNDRRRGRRAEDLGLTGLSDDEASEVDERPSRLDQDD